MELPPITSKKTVLILVGILACLAFLTYSFIAPQGLFSGLPNDLKSIAPEGSEASYTTLDGVVVDLEEFKGKPLIVLSWASWTPFSAAELNLLAELKSVHGDKLHLLAINRMEPVPVIRAYLEAFSVPDTLMILVDPSDHFYRAVGGYAMPETVLYDRDGNMVTHVRGTIRPEEFTAQVDALVASE